MNFGYGLSTMDYRLNNSTFAPMIIELLKSKIHRAKVTQAELNYVGSITIDEDLMDAANLIANEKVQIEFGDPIHITLRSKAVPGAVNLFHR